MQAIRVHKTGGPDVLVAEDVPVPEPQEGELLVRVEAAGLNFIDTYHRSGAYPMPLPFTPGLEGSGVVEALGTGVTGRRVGERVAWATAIGSYAELAAVSAGGVEPVPDGVSGQQAAAIMLQGMTAHYLSHSTVPLAPGMTALVHAAAGGVGLLLTQLAKKRGARVLGTCSTDEKEALARAAGADEVIRYREVDLVKTVRALTDGAGVDVVYDGVGKDTFAAGLDCLKVRGHMVLYGQASGAVEPIDPQVLSAKGSLFLTRPTLFHHSADPAERAWRAGDLFGWIAAGELDVRIDRTFPVAEAAAAHEYIEAGKTRGKVLLIP